MYYFAFYIYNNLIFIIEHSVFIIQRHFIEELKYRFNLNEFTLCPMFVKITHLMYKLINLFKLIGDLFKQ